MGIPRFHFLDTRVIHKVYVPCSMSSQGLICCSYVVYIRKVLVLQLKNRERSDEGLEHQLVVTQSSFFTWTPIFLLRAHILYIYMVSETEYNTVNQPSLFF